MSINTIPKVLYTNKIANILDKIRFETHKLSGKGTIYGLIAIDQDAKIIAIDSRFDRKLNYWDLSSIGAALYGISRQGQDFFKANKLERATIMYDDLQIFVKSVGAVILPEKGEREVLIVFLSERHTINLAILIFQMSNFAKEIKKEIIESSEIKKTLELTEIELKEHLQKLKKTIFLKQKVEE